VNEYISFINNHLPEIILTVTSVLVLFVDFALVRSRTLAFRSTTASAIAILGCIACAAEILRPFVIPSSEGVEMVGFANETILLAILTITACVLLLSSANSFTDHPAEFNFLIVIATIGMMVLLGAHDLLTFFLSLELLSISLYALTAFDKNNPRSSEAALKYFLFGGISAAFLLFGFSFFYGVCDSLWFGDIYRVAQNPAPNPLLAVALVCTVIGFGFKIAAAPFHFWAPDAYEGAPAPAAAFMASASKVASFSAFLTIFVYSGLSPLRGSAAWGHMLPGWAPILAFLAVISMLFGNLVALRQTSLRRLIAYSAIAHTGYMLLGFVATVLHSPIAGAPDSSAPLAYYVITYAVGTVGLLAIVAAVEDVDGSDMLTNFDGLARRSPILAACLFIFLLSLAGIPPLAGFFAKFYVFMAALETPGLLWLVVIALAASAVALYYYLKVLRRALIAAPSPHAKIFKTHPAFTAVAVITAAAVVFLGVMPNLLLTWLSK
jgi:NADH-quinone oxidoreductase subunit N